MLVLSVTGRLVWARPVATVVEALTAALCVPDTTYV